MSSTGAGTARVAPVATLPKRSPSWQLQTANIVVLHLAWFAVVLGAAHEMPLWGTASIVLSIVWHLYVVAKPVAEFKLLTTICLLGFGLETLNVHLGMLAYPSGQPDPALAPYWMVALWGLLAITLNVTLRFLKKRLWLAALLGAVAGPLSFVSGVQLGGATFLHERPALIWLAVSWAAMMPLLMVLSNRWDGVSAPQPAAAI